MASNKKITRTADTDESTTDTRAALSEKTVKSLPIPAKGNKLHYFSGDTLQGKKAPAGFAVRVTAAGTKSFVWFHRVEGRPHLETIGRWDENPKGGSLNVLQAIMAANARVTEISKPGSIADPRPARTRTIENANRPEGETVGDVLDKFVERYVEKDAKLRSAGTIRSAFDRLVKPAIGNTPIYELRRTVIVEMLDDIADNSGPVMADRVLAYIRKAFNWRAARDDLFNSPIVKGMARTKPNERRRERILSDAEIRKVWITAGAQSGPFPALVRFLLLTAARRNEAACMTWQEIDGSDWQLPASRNKAKIELVRPLSKTAFAAMKPFQRDGRGFVFSTDAGKTPISGFSKFKRAFDKASGTSGWSLHDLRRTARSLLSRAGVNSDIAERCLGHVIGGVRGTYDRQEYHAEKRKAFEALAALLDRILKPASNVTEIAGRRR
jgi:integrase